MTVTLSFGNEGGRLPPHTTLIHPRRRKDMENEVRTTNPVTGGEKGQKLARYDLLPVRPLEEVASIMEEALLSTPRGTGSVVTIGPSAMVLSRGTPRHSGEARPLTLRPAHITWLPWSSMPLLSSNFETHTRNSMIGLELWNDE